MPPFLCPVAPSLKGGYNGATKIKGVVLVERRFEQLLSQSEDGVFSIPIRDQKNLSAIMKALSLEEITFSVLPSECGWMIQMSMETYEDDLSLFVESQG